MWPSGIRYCTYIQKVPGSILLGAGLGLGVQPQYEAPSDLRVKISKTQVINTRGCPLNNASKSWPRDSQIEVKKMRTL